MSPAASPIGRRLCHCGSGKRYNSCCRDKDARSRIFGATFVPTEGGLITGIGLGPNGEVRMLCGDEELAVDQIKTAEWRQAAKGLRVKSQINSDTMFINPEAALAHMDYVFGVDTNQEKVCDKKIHISCMTCATREIAAPGWEGTIQHIKALDFVDDKYPAERIGWVFALKAIAQSGLTGARIALCTDHDLNAHTAINRRSEPIIEDFYLPDNVTLVYANEAGSAFTNKLIGAAHRGAKKIAQMIREGDSQPQYVLDHLMGKDHSPGKRIWFTQQFLKEG